MKLKFILSALLVAAVSLAQKRFDIPKITPADFEQKASKIEPSAEAEYLYEIGEVRFRYDNAESAFHMVTTVKARIRIYNKSGYGFGNIEIPYYAATAGREKVSIDGCYVYNLVNGQVEKTKLKSDGIFDSKENKYWSQKKIAMPAVKEGSIIEYEYSIDSPRIFNLPDWDFQSTIPVVYSEFRTTIPEYFSFSHNQRGFIPLEIENGTAQASVHFTEKSTSGVHVQQTVYEGSDVKYSENVAVYRLKNLKALKEEKYMSSYRNYLCSISHELMMTRFPNSGVKSYSTDWPKVAENIHKDADFGGELSKTGYFEDALKSLLAGVSSPEEKTLRIYNFVKENVKWNNRKTYWCDEGVKTAFKQKTGNAAEINLMLTAMLRYAGLDSNPVLISTRSHGISLFPATAAFDFVVSSVSLSGKTVLLDATEPYASPSILPLRDLNWQGLMIDKNGLSKEVVMAPTDFSAESLTLAYKLNAQGTAEGKFRRQFSSNKALEYRSKSVGRNAEQYLEELENAFGKVEISDYKRENERECHKDFIESGGFRKDAAVEAIGDKLYFSPLLFLAEAENPFKMENREYPVDFGYPTRGKMLILIDLPEGYAVETLPAATNIATEASLGTFKYNIAANGPKLQLMVNYEISAAIVPTDSYAMLRDFYQKIVDKQNEKIVLKRI